MACQGVFEDCCKYVNLCAYTEGLLTLAFFYSYLISNYSALLFTAPKIVIEAANGAAETLDGLTLDWVAGNLYWSTSGNRQIWISRLDGAWPRLLIDTGSGSGNASQHSWGSSGSGARDESIKRRPAALAVDPINRYLFFNLWFGTRGRIERTWLDGTHRRVIVNHEHAAWPNGIALDIANKQLYFVDAYLAVIKRVDYEGRETPTQIVTGNLQHPFGFDLLGELSINLLTP